MVTEVYNQSIQSFFGIIPDKVRDASDVKQLVLVLRYTKGK